MLKAYEVIIENGQLTWLEGQPPILSARAVITILEEMPIIDQENQQNLFPRRRFPIPSLAGKAKTLGDIVSPIIDEADWECLK